MDNPARTAEYLARQAARRAALRAQLSSIIVDNKRVTWELGCGHGHFLTSYAKAHPDLTCLGIDIIAERIERAEKKRKRADLANLHFILAEARLFLGELPANTHLGDVFILFPDPWPKARHHKHRIIQEDFLTELGQKASADTRLCFRTDYKPYFDEAAARIGSHPAWTVSDEAWPFEFETVFQSRAPAHYSLIARRRTPSIS